MKNSKIKMKKNLVVATVASIMATTMVVNAEVSDATVSVKAMADALHLVMDSDRSALQSMWPINKQNAPKTKAEKDGLKYVAENKGKNYYTTEKLGGKDYFTAVYADTGVAPVCVSCHNKHPDTPKKDFKIGDVMGGVVIRIPVEG